MASLKDLQNQLRQFPCHFMWNLEYKSMKQFQSLMDLVNEHNAESPAMVIEGLLFKSYLFFSDFRGNAEKKKHEAIECLDEVRTMLTYDRRETSLKDGYIAISLALEAWLDRDKTKLEAKISTLRTFESKYEAGSRERDMFLGTIHATKGFAFSRLGMIRYAESIEQFRKAVDMCPEEKEWWFLLGHIIWKKGIPSVKPGRICTEMKTAQSIFYDVLKMDYGHSYALVLIAELKRRENRIEKAEYFLECALTSNPTRKKIIGEVAKVYRKMGNYDKALEILRTAEKMPEPNSFIYHQIYLVYRAMNIPPPVDYLQKAIDANPSNLAAKFDRAKHFISKEEYVNAHEYFDHIMDNHGNDPEAVINTNYNFAKFLEKRNKLEDAIDKFQVVLDEALEECKENNDPPFNFFNEIDWMVRISLKKLRGYFGNKVKADRNDKESFLKLAELEKKLGNTRKACWYYQQVIELQPPIDAELRWRILEDLAVMKTRNALLTDVDSIIQDMEHLNLTEPNPDILQMCKANLAVEKGEIALQDGKENDALNLFVEAVTFGSLTGARLLLGEVKKMDRGNRDFYTNCAKIDVCIERSHGDDTQQLKEDLDKLLSADTSDIGNVLSDLRNTQFNMERCSILQDKKQLGVLRVDVIHKCRTILNQTMTKFRDRHYGHIDISCDYFNISKFSSAKVAHQVRNKLQRKYGWAQFEQQFQDLFNFLVSIQPASNPHDNNWMFALFRMDNANKHESALGDKLKVEVYTDHLGNMAEKEFTTLEVAREACDNIGKILDKFYKHL